jgi:hypothetical protein
MRPGPVDDIVSAAATGPTAHWTVPSVCPEILSANQEVEGLRELLKQLDVLRAKSRSVAVTEPVKLARGPLV